MYLSFSHLSVTFSLPDSESNVCLTCLSLSDTRLADVSGCVFSANYRQPTSVLHRCEQGSTPPPACSETFLRFCKTIYQSIHLSGYQYRVIFLIFFGKLIHTFPHLLLLFISDLTKCHFLFLTDLCLCRCSFIQVSQLDS